MPSQAKTHPGTASKAYQQLDVLGPSEGVDLRLSATLLPSGRARTLVNWSLEEPGALVVRPGYVQHSTAALGASRVQGARRVYLNSAIPSPTSTAVTVVAWSQGIYNQNVNGTWASTTPYLTGLSTAEIDFPADRDLVAALDGSTLLYKSTNGSSWTRFGLVRPSGQSSCSSLSSGSLLAAEFEFNFTYKDRDLAVESNGSSSPSTITLGATGAIELQIPNSTDAQIDAIVVYARNKTSGETIRRKASSFAMQGGLHSTVRITSSGWGTNDEEPTDHDHAGWGLNFGVVWKNRWWARDATTTNRLRFTQLFQPQSWPALFFIDMPFERGDEIRALLPLGDAMLVFGDTKILLILGQTSLDFEVRPTLASQDGALGFRSVCVIENGAVHAGASGVWIFDGVTDKLLSYDIEPAWQDLVQNASPDALARTACVYHLKRKELRIAVARRYPSGQPGEWILDMNRSRDGKTAWTATDRDITGYVPWDGPEKTAGHRGRLLSWPSTQGLLMEEATGYAANGSNATAQYEGPGLTLGTIRGRWIDLRVEYEPNAGALTEQAVIDGVTMPSNSINIGGSLAQYSSGLYGTATYGGAGRRQAYVLRPLQAEGRTYVQTFSYAGQQKFRLFSYHQGISPETRSRAFSE